MGLATSAIAASLMLLATGPGGELSGFMDAAKLVTHCGAQADDKEGEVTVAICYGYIAGAWDQILARGGNQRPFCPPKDLTLDEIRIELLEYLEKNPEQEQSAAALVIERSAVAAHPCERPRLRLMRLWRPTGAK